MYFVFFCEFQRNYTKFFMFSPIIILIIGFSYNRRILTLFNPTIFDIVTSINSGFVIIGINLNPPFHYARHTFATTMTPANQVSTGVVSKMLVCTEINLNMTRKYARVGEDLINRDMQKIFGKSNNVMVQWKHCACY